MRSRLSGLLIIACLGISWTRVQAQGADTLALRLEPQLQLPNPATPSAPASHRSAAQRVDQPVQVLDCPPPKYPTALAEYGFPGSVALRFVVDTSGRAEADDLIVVEASNAGFISAARRAISKCRYAPARQAGRPVRVLVQQSVVFTPYKKPGN